LENRNLLNIPIEAVADLSLLCLRLEGSIERCIDQRI